MKKQLLTLAGAMLFTLGAYAEATPYVASVGTTLNYTTVAYPEEGDSVSVTTVATVTSSDVQGDVTTYLIEEVTAAPNTPMGAITETSTTTFNAADGVTTIIMDEAESSRKEVLNMIVTMAQQSGQFISDGDMQDIEKQVTARGQIDIAISPDMAEGTKLPKKSLKVNAGPSLFGFNLWEGVILGNETITTAAGEFNCLKLSYVMRISMDGQNERNLVTEWYAPNVGLVKSLTTTKKGKLISKQELSEIVK